MPKKPWDFIDESKISRFHAVDGHRKDGSRPQDAKALQRNALTAPQSAPGAEMRDGDPNRFAEPPKLSLEEEAALLAEIPPNVLKRMLERRFGRPIEEICADSRIVEDFAQEDGSSGHSIES